MFVLRVLYASAAGDFGDFKVTSFISAKFITPFPVKFDSVMLRVVKNLKILRSFLPQDDRTVKPLEDMVMALIKITK
jgi:hypothetical protein